MHSVNPQSVLFITLDSCRYDTFCEASAPYLKSVGPLVRAAAPGNFTYGSHSAMFVGFTPGVAHAKQPFINPKFGKLFKMEHGGFLGAAEPHFNLTGKNIIDGFNRIGYSSLGSGAVGWFNPSTQTGQNLTTDFQKFYFPGNLYSLDKQLDWLFTEIGTRVEPLFVFLNIGETHVPYYHKDAPWDRTYNPCVPFSDNNDASECRRRQIACVEYIDTLLSPLLEMFKQCTTLICADHGDCWGEDGLWEHGIHHPKVLEVPLLIRLGKQTDPAWSTRSALNLHKS